MSRVAIVNLCANRKNPNKLSVYVTIGAKRYDKMTFYFPVIAKNEAIEKVDCSSDWSLRG